MSLNLKCPIGPFYLDLPLLLHFLAIVIAEKNYSNRIKIYIYFFKMNSIRITTWT